MRVLTVCNFDSGTDGPFYGIIHSLSTEVPDSEYHWLPRLSREGVDLFDVVVVGYVFARTFKDVTYVFLLAILASARESNPEQPQICKRTKDELRECLVHHTEPQLLETSGRPRILDSNPPDTVQADCHVPFLSAGISEPFRSL